MNVTDLRGAVDLASERDGLRRDLNDISGREVLSILGAARKPSPELRAVLRRYIEDDLRQTEAELRAMGVRLEGDVEGAPRTYSAEMFGGTA